MNIQKGLVLLIGEQQSNQNAVFEILTKQKYQQSILERINPVQVKSQNMYIMILPSFCSYQKEIQPFFPFIKDYLKEFQYQLVQIAFCLNFEYSIDKTVQEIIDSLENLKFQQYKNGITFMINNFDSKKNKDFKFKNNDKASLLLLNSKNIEEKVSQWFLEKVKITSHLWWSMESPEKFNQIHFFEKMIENWIFEYKKAEYQDLSQFLESLEKKQDYHTLNLLNDLNQTKNLSNDITLFFEVQLFKANLKNFRDNYHWQFKKYNFPNFFCNFIVCNKCFKLFSIDEPKEYSLSPSSKFQSCDLINKRIDNRLNQCPNCRQNLSKGIDDLIRFVTGSIIQLCINSYYNFFWKQTIELEQNNVEQNNNNKKIQGWQNIVEENNQQNNSAEHKIATNQSLIKIEKNKSQEENPIQSILLSCENDEKSFIFTKLYYPIDKNKIKQHKEFKIGNTLLNKFNLIDAPSFQFTTNQDQTIAQFKDFFKKFDVHFIFLFTDYQRTDLMKDRINSMLKKLIKIDRNRMAIVITNWQKCTDPEIATEIEQLASAKNIETIIYIRQDDKQDQILNQFYLCLENKIPNKISFQGTVFAQETQEELLQEKQLDEQLAQFSKQIEEEQKIALQNKLEAQISREEKLENDIKELEDQIKKKRGELWELRDEKRETQNILWKLYNQNQYYNNYNNKAYGNQKNVKRR